ncbi:MAG: polyprenyl synthetase family protein [Acidimicrobiales bacterium]
MTLANSLSKHENEASALEILARAKSLVNPALEAATQRLSPELRPLVRHHFSAGGKYVRASLALISANAGGASDDAGLVGALAIELIHNFSLIHDDIIDGDVERRHEPTVWAKYGVGPAIIAGDALSTLAFQLLLDNATPSRVRAAARLAEATQAMIVGQAEDIASEHQLSLSVEECLRMEAGKTGALLSCAASIGAILAGASEPVIEALSEFGDHLGQAFQAIDDMLGVWGESSVTGKPVGNDLRLRKKTLPVCIANAKGFDVFGEIASSSEDDLTDAEVAAAMTLLDDCGARYETAEMAEAELRSALAALERAPMEPSARTELAILARYVIERDQ